MLINRIKTIAVTILAIASLFGFVQCFSALDETSSGACYVPGTDMCIDDWESGEANCEEDDGDGYNWTFVSGGSCTSLTGSSSSSSSSTSSTSSSSSSGGTVSYITWSGSANGDIVKDVNGDSVRFAANGGYMYIGNTKINNCYVSGNNIYWNSSYIGDVTYVKSTTSSKITALVSTTDHYIDIYGSSGSYYWKDTDTTPAFWK